MKISHWFVIFLAKSVFDRLKHVLANNSPIRLDLGPEIKRSLAVKKMALKLVDEDNGLSV